MPDHKVGYDGWMAMCEVAEWTFIGADVRNIGCCLRLVSLGHCVGTGAETLKGAPSQDKERA